MEDIGDFLYFFLIAAYGIYSLFSGGKKEENTTPTPVSAPKKQRRQAPLAQTPVVETQVVEQKPKYNTLTKSPQELEREIQAKLEKAQENKRRFNSQPHSTSNAPLTKPSIVALEEKLRPAPERKGRYFTYDDQEIERHNIDVSPKIHQENIDFKPKKEDNSNAIAKNIKLELKKAIVYKEILDAKYF